MAREIGVPAIVGVSGATDSLYTGMEITVSCAEGEEGYVYAGIYEHEIERVELSNMQETQTKIYINIGNPEKAFGFSQLPNHGVGLARMEMIILNQIKAHPLALVDLHHKKSVKEKMKLKTLMAGYANPKDFFVKKKSLKRIGMISAAFYPKPVIVRTSDFKSNEYIKMLGGSSYEPNEENPMFGYRGASRYYSESYNEAFSWECEALALVREEMGLTNMKVMIPFCEPLKRVKSPRNLKKKQFRIR